MFGEAYAKIPSMGMIIFVCIFNFLVSWWNARICGMTWVEANALGLSGKILVWAGAIQSGVGFTSILVLVELAVFASFSTSGLGYLFQVLALGYLGLAVPIIGCLLLILLNAWVGAYKKQDVVSIGLAGVNTITAGKALAASYEGIGSSYRTVMAMFDEEGNWKTATAICVGVVSFGLGGLTTYLLIKHYMAVLTLPIVDERLIPTEEEEKIVRDKERELERQQTFVQSTPPVGHPNGVWYDTSNFYKINRWKDGRWQVDKISDGSTDLYR